MIPLEKYAVAKDHCCIGYFGPDLDILQELVAARPVIEHMLPGMKVYISCRPDFIAKFTGHERMIPSTELKSQRQCFGFFQEIRHNGRVSPVQELLSGIQSAKECVQKLD